MKTLRTLGIIAVMALASACDRGTNAAGSSGPPPAGATMLQLKVEGMKYLPSSMTAPPNKPVRLTIKRVSDDGCGQQIVFPSLDIRRDLPLNEAVAVDFTMPASGTVAFTCGMNMMRGSIEAK